MYVVPAADVGDLEAGRLEPDRQVGDVPFSAAQQRDAWLVHGSCPPLSREAVPLRSGAGRRAHSAGRRSVGRVRRASGVLLAPVPSVAVFVVVLVVLVSLVLVVLVTLVLIVLVLLLVAGLLVAGLLDVAVLVASLFFASLFVAGFLRVLLFAGVFREVAGGIVSAIGVVGAVAD